MAVYMLYKSVCILAHLKEICFFFSIMYFTAAIRAFSLFKLTFCKVVFTGGTVHTLIFTLINISLLIKFFKYLLYLKLMITVGCSHKLIIRRIHKIPYCLYTPNCFIYIFLRCFSCLNGL